MNKDIHTNFIGVYIYIYIHVAGTKGTQYNEELQITFNIFLYSPSVHIYNIRHSPALHIDHTFIRHGPQHTDRSMYHIPYILLLTARGL